MLTFVMINFMQAVDWSILFLGTVIFLSKFFESYNIVDYCDAHTCTSHMITIYANDAMLFSISFQHYIYAFGLDRL